MTRVTGVERPILFSAEMVRALRDNRKAQTRRTRGLEKINAEPDAWRLLGFVDGRDRWWFQNSSLSGIDGSVEIKCPYGVAGDKLWTREAWRADSADDALPPRDVRPPIWYAADGIPFDGFDFGKLRSSMFLPRWGSRDTLEIVSVRPERLQAITEEEAEAEGVDPLSLTAAEIADIQISDESPDMKELARLLGPGRMPARSEFEMLWSRINGIESWAKNPWLWRIEFRRLNGKAAAVGSL